MSLYLMGKLEFSKGSTEKGEVFGIWNLYFCISKIAILKSSLEY
jgi:hypothetical protein